MIDEHIHFHKQPYTLETIENMVSVAKEKNIDEIWLLDHTHKFHEFIFLYEPVMHNELSANWFRKKKFISINEYLDFISLVKSRAYDVKIKFGLEVCYFPETENLLREELKKYQFDFLIGAVHFIDGIGFDLSKEAWIGVDVDQMYKRYYEIMELLIESELFTTLAHPDSIKLYNYYPTYDLKPTYLRIAQLLNKHQMSTENNTGLWRYQFPYPGLNPEFLEVLKKAQVRIHLSSDAHEYKYIGAYFNCL